MNTLHSTATDISDRLACSEIVWEWVCELDTPPKGDSWDEAWLARVEARHTELMERTDLLHLPAEVAKRLDALYAEA